MPDVAEQAAVEAEAAVEIKFEDQPWVAMQCDECGDLRVCHADEAEKLAKERPDDPEQQTGHHVHPEDPDSDWICYGHPAVIDHPEAIKAFIERGVYGVAELKIAKADQLVLGSVSRDERVEMLASGEFVRTASDPNLAINAIDAQIEELTRRRDEMVRAKLDAAPDIELEAKR